MLQYQLLLRICAYLDICNLFIGLPCHSTIRNILMCNEVWRNQKNWLACFHRQKWYICAGRMFHLYRSAKVLDMHAYSLKQSVTIDVRNIFLWYSCFQNKFDIILNLLYSIKLSDIDTKPTRYTFCPPSH